MRNRSTNLVDPSDRPEWLQPPSRILVQRRSRLGGWYYLLRPLAITYAALFRALREVLVVVVYVGWWVFWLIEQLVSALLGALIWLLYAFTGLRHGQAAEDALRRSAVDSEAAGRAWRQRFNARLARRIGWAGDDPDNRPRDLT